MHAYGVDNVFLSHLEINKQCIDVIGDTFVGNGIADDQILFLDQ